MPDGTDPANHGGTGITPVLKLTNPIGQGTTRAKAPGKGPTVPPRPAGSEKGPTARARVSTPSTTARDEAVTGAANSSAPGQVLGAPPIRARGRHWVAAGLFMLMVVLPTVLAGAYLTFIAADRYGSRTAFSVRSNEVTAPLEILGTVTQLGNSSAVLDGQILYDFIRSQQIVEMIARDLPLEDYWNLQPEDWWFSLGADQPIEEITEHWGRFVDVSLDPASGILTVEARAFRPEHAHAIARAILDASANLVNTLADTARADAVAHAEYELGEAEVRLRDIRARLRVFRDFEQEVDPSQNARVAIELVAGLEEELSERQTQLELLAASLSPSSPRIQLLKRRIATLEARVAAERTRLGTGIAGGDGSARPLAAVVGDFEELVVDREFAEQAYTLALSTLEQAQAEARRRHRYLAAHVQPTLSEKAGYPDRPLLTAAVLGLTLTAWLVLMMVGWNIRDRR